jgi:hypothetical protein
MQKKYKIGQQQHRWRRSNNHVCRTRAGGRSSHVDETTGDGEVGEGGGEAHCWFDKPPPQKKKKTNIA